LFHGQSPFVGGSFLSKPDASHRSEFALRRVHWPGFYVGIGGWQARSPGVFAVSEMTGDGCDVEEPACEHRFLPQSACAPGQNQEHCTRNFCGLGRIAVRRSAEE
jgi:hypothetical protein